MGDFLPRKSDGLNAIFKWTLTLARAQDIRFETEICLVLGED